jgi:hypothetical protein
MHRDIADENNVYTGGPIYCSTGWERYKELKNHPTEEACKKGMDKWRLINYPTCGILKEGDISDGMLVDLPREVCYPPYTGYNCRSSERTVWTFKTILWWIVWTTSILSAKILSLIDDEMLLGFLSMPIALHCDGERSCRFKVGLEVGKKKKDPITGEEWICWPGMESKDSETCSRIPFSSVGGIIDWWRGQNPTTFPVP